MNWQIKCKQVAMLLHDAKSKLCYNSALSGFQEGVKSGTARVGLLDFSLRFSFFFLPVCLCLIFRTFRIFPINLIKCVCSFVYATICVGIACHLCIYTDVWAYNTRIYPNIYIYICIWVGRVTAQNATCCLGAEQEGADEDLGQLQHAEAIP